MAFAYQGIKKIKIPVKPDEIRTSQGAIAVFNKYLTSFSYTEKNKFDDSIDSIAMYAEKWLQNRSKMNSITILSRK